MEKILFDLFEALDDGNITSEEENALQQVEKICQNIQEKLTLQEFNEIWGAALQVGTARTKNSFAKGFRLGARVMMEVLKDH